MTRERGDGLSAPVGALGETVRGDDTVLLDLLAAGAAGCGDVDLRAGDGVFGDGLLVDVEGDARVIGFDITRDAYKVLAGDLKRTFRAILDEDLSTAGVELRIAGVSAVQSKDFGANEVVSGGETGGQVDGEKSLVLDEGIDAPSVGLGVVPILPDLEPARTSSLGREHVVDLLDIYSTGTLVALGNGTSVASTGTHTELEGQASTTGGRTHIVDGCVSEAALKSVSKAWDVGLGLETHRKPYHRH